jgi:3-oxoacyl-[acyl-carrier-protein] synthase-1
MPAPVYISGIGLCCQSGNEPFALFTAVATHFDGACSHERIDGALPRSGATAKLQHVPVPYLESGKSPHERIAALAETALREASDRLSEKIPSGAVLVLTLVPPEKTARGSNLDLMSLQQDLASCHPLVNGAGFRFVPDGQGAVKTLRQACTELEEGEWQAILFGGADSLLDMVTLSEMAGIGGAMLQGGEEGTLPGEGAAYLVLEKQASPGALAKIDALAAAPEPNHGQAHEKKMTGMATVLQSVFQGAGTTPGKLDSIVLPFGCTMPESLEWHQALEVVWPRRKQIPRSFEVLLPAGAIGTTGAANLPLGLALGCARFEFDFAPAERLIVCEAENGPSRGAVFLKKSLNHDYGVSSAE